MLDSKNITIKGEDNVLEAEISRKKTNQINKIVLLCHPHPQFHLTFSRKGKIRG
jgi:alpha/beta superfamily hydrolase